jgi:hypothetical protein
MWKSRFFRVILAAVLGVVSLLVSVASAAPVVLARDARPQSSEWFEEVTGYHTPAPPTFQAAVEELDAYWDAQAAQNCSPTGCRPRFGGVLLQGSCGSVTFHLGDVFWGGWYDPNKLSDGVEAMSMSVDGWAGIYRVTVDHFNIPVTENCAGGRYLRELEFAFIPIVLR